MAALLLWTLVSRSRSWCHYPEEAGLTVVVVVRELRKNAPKNKVQLAIGRCLEAVMDESGWTELGLLTDTKAHIYNHPRLLRSLRFGDDDYKGHVFDLVPVLLGRNQENTKVVCDFISLDRWLQSEDPALHAEIFEESRVSRVTEDLEEVEGRLDIPEVQRQARRIRQDIEDDPEAAIGHTKDLLESVCKTILPPLDGRVDLPTLVKRTMIHLRIDPTQAGAGPEAATAKRLLGAVASIVNAAAELRNSHGIGHGRSGEELVDPALARLSIGVALPAAIFLLEKRNQPPL